MERQNNAFIKLCSLAIVKNQVLSKSNGLLSSLGTKMPLSQVFILGPISFWGYKMNKIINKILLAGDKFMPEMYLW